MADEAPAWGSPVTSNAVVVIHDKETATSMAKEDGG
jgi:hypothetical protein